MTPTSTTLELAQSALPAPTSILSCTLSHRPFLITTSHDSIHILDESAQLVESISFREAFPHYQPSTEQGGEGGGISVISVDETSNRIVACLRNRFAVFEPNTIGASISSKPWSSWRVHSSLTIPNNNPQSVNKIESIDFKRGNEIRFYSLTQEFGLPNWKQISSSIPFELAISHLRLLPTTNDSESVGGSSEWILAILPRNSSTCLIYDLTIPTTTTTTITSGEGFKFVSRSKAVHSIRLKSIEWRNPSITSTTTSDSGPILMTTTIQNSIHLWGCVIDEPKEFSLWISIPSPPPSTPSPLSSTTTTTNTTTTRVVGRSPLIPIDQNNAETRVRKKQDKKNKNQRLRTVWSGYWKTVTVSNSNRKQDLFWSLLESGEFYLTIVSNLDSRPPTCLTSQTKLVTSSFNHSGPPIPYSELYNFRTTFLLKSRSNPISTIHLISLSSPNPLNSLLHTRLTFSLSSNDHQNEEEEEQEEKEQEVQNIEELKFSKPFINYVGYVRKLVKSFPLGENLLVLGNPPPPPDLENGTKKRGGGGGCKSNFKVRLQSWQAEDEGRGVMGSLQENVLDLNAQDGEEEIGKKRIASWLRGKRIVVGEGSNLRIYSLEDKDEEKDGILRLIVEQDFKGGDEQVEFDQAKAFFVVRRFEDDLQTWIIAVTKTLRTPSTTPTPGTEAEETEEDETKKKRRTTTKEYDYVLNSWIYHSPSNKIFRATTPQPITPSNDCQDKEETIVWVSIVPPPSSSDEIDSIELQSCDSQGCIKTWRLDLTNEEESKWKVSGEGLKTGRKRVRRTSSKGNGVIALATDDELTIWNEKNSKFGTALEFSQSIETDESPVVSLEFSIDTNVLALASYRKVWLFIQTRRNTSSRWIQIAIIEPNTPFRITNLQFHSSGLSIACESQLFFYSFEFSKPSSTPGNLQKELELEIRDQAGSVGLLDCVMLTRLIEFGHLEIVLKFFKLLARELDEDGKLVQRLSSLSHSTSKLGTKEILEEMQRKRIEREGQETTKGGGKDLVTSLSTAAELALRKKALNESKHLSSDERSRLVTCLERGDAFKGLSREDHSGLARVVQIVYEVQTKTESIDSFGVRYLSAIRNLAPLGTDGESTDRQLPCRDILFAYHSKDQQSLLDESIEILGKGKLTWEQAKSVGIPLWLKNQDLLSRTIELIGRTSFLQNPESRDPILSTLFYLSLKKLPQVYTFWKQSLGHSDQRLMLKFLSNDFDQERWKLAAKKNAFALLSKRRFLFAAGFFLLGDSLADSISVILKHLKDPYLAIAIARVYENKPNHSSSQSEKEEEEEVVGTRIGPVLRDVLIKEILPNALEIGDRFLICWSLELLGEKELSKRVLIESLPRINFERLNLGDTISINNPTNEDSSRVIFVQHLLEKSRGGMINGKTEFEFTLYIARQLCESGFHLLAIDLLRSYKFSSSKSTLKIRLVTSEPTPESIPSVEQKKNKQEPMNFIEPDTSSLFDMLSSPSREPDPSPSPSPVREVKKEEEEEESEEEKRKRLFREASGLGGKKVETKNTVEAFSFDAFGF
ncbi:hypothetical protein JCM3765_007577 [Sporobolomyces pararoseus]